MAVLLWLLLLQHSCAMSTQRHIAAGNLVTPANTNASVAHSEPQETAGNHQQGE